MMKAPVTIAKVLAAFLSRLASNETCFFFLFIFRWKVSIKSILMRHWSVKGELQQSMGTLEICCEAQSAFTPNEQTADFLYRIEIFSTIYNFIISTIFECPNFNLISANIEHIPEFDPPGMGTCRHPRTSRVWRNGGKWENTLTMRRGLNKPFELLLLLAVTGGIKCGNNHFSVFMITFLLLEFYFSGKRSCFCSPISSADDDLKKIKWPTRECYMNRTKLK